MTLQPLLQATAPIPLHAAGAFVALVLGAAQFALPKGTGLHRAMGWIWVTLMAVVAASSFWIHTICMVGLFSPIHLLSVFTLAALVVAVAMAQRGRVAQHRQAMIAIYAGALVIAGLFTFLPGRIMHDVAFGSTDAHGSCI